MAQNLTGDWTYRSFLNNPQPVDGNPQAALGLIFGEGALRVIAADPGTGFKAELSFGGDAVMDLVGSYAEGQDGKPAVIRANGRGRPKSGIEDFDYDYIFYPVDSWPGGADQRPALVGTVIRSADHGRARKGAVASTITVKQG